MLRCEKKKRAFGMPPMRFAHCETINHPEGWVNNEHIRRAVLRDKK